MNLRSLHHALMGIYLAAFASAITWADSLPTTSHDGLELQHDTKLKAVYLKPGADLSEYNKVALLDCSVAFKKHWRRDYNEETVNLSDRISDKDMAGMRDQVAKEFNAVFTEVLTEGGHELVTEGGTGVLVVQPSIVDLDVTAPDKMSPGSEYKFAADAGEMTLYMQLYDGRTGDLIARVIDPEVVGKNDLPMRNLVSNSNDMERTMRYWATVLNDHLGQLKTATSADSSGS